jgi:hypothetical protein
VNFTLEVQCRRFYVQRIALERMNTADDYGGNKPAKCFQTFMAQIIRDIATNAGLRRSSNLLCASNAVQIARDGAHYALRVWFIDGTSALVSSGSYN